MSESKILTAVVLLLLVVSCRDTKTESMDSNHGERPSQVAVVNYSRTVQWPYEYADILVAIDRDIGRGNWEQVISAYKDMLNDEAVAASANLRSEVFILLGEAYLKRSNGSDVNGYLICLCLASNEDLSQEQREPILNQIHAVSISLGRPELVIK